ncbi:MAG: TolC family protein, partial [Alphaproteobacteria bacterium]
MLAAALAAVLAGCAAPDIGTRPDLGNGETVAASRTFAGAGSTAAAPDDAWWRAFGDPQLNGLIDEALARSPTLAIAAARIAQADAAASRQAASDRPSVDVGGAVQEVRQSLNNGFPPAFKSFLPHGWHDEARVSASLNYELDFFGRNRAALAAATSTADAARADAAAARLTLSTAVAGAYATLAQLYA